MNILNILAIDAALKTGWATLINGRIESGVQDFTKKRGESNGLVFMRFNAWLDGLYRMGIRNVDNRCLRSFELVVYEQAHHRGGAATNLCVGMTTRVEEFAQRISAECMPIHTATLKKYATGSGRASKEQMIEAFEAATYRRAITDDEADAYFLLKLAMNEFNIIQGE